MCPQNFLYDEVKIQLESARIYESVSVLSMSINGMDSHLFCFRKAVLILRRKNTLIAKKQKIFQRK